MTVSRGPGAGADLLVKICGITSEADALLAVGLGADALGFVFAPSARQMTRQAVRRIVERLPRGILTVGVFRDDAPARVVETVNGIGLDAAQLHGSEPADECRWVAERVRTVIRALPAGHPEVGEALGYGASLVLVDATSPGSGEVFDWRLAEGVVDPSRLLVAGGLTPGNVAAAVAHLRPRGVDVSTGVESAPGVKDPRLLQAFIAAARGAGAAPAGAWAGGEAGADAGPETPGDGVEDLGPVARPEGGPFDWMVEG